MGKPNPFAKPEHVPKPTDDMPSHIHSKLFDGKSEEEESAANNKSTPRNKNLAPIPDDAEPLTDLVAKVNSVNNVNNALTANPSSILHFSVKEYHSSKS